MPLFERFTRSPTWPLAVGVPAALLVAVAAEARITRIVVDAIVPDASGYERVQGTAHGEVNPVDLQNAIIQDLALAPRHARGMVEYTTEFEGAPLLTNTDSAP